VSYCAGKIERKQARSFILEARSGSSFSPSSIFMAYAQAPLMADAPPAAITNASFSPCLFILEDAVTPLEQEK